jgi:uncharacterized protein YndB with AHSA1/START domain
MTTTSIVIDRPADDVFAYVTDPTQFHQWYKASSPVPWRSPAPPLLGLTAQ